MLSPQLYCFPQRGVCVLFRTPALGSLSGSDFPAVSLFVRETHFLFCSTPRTLWQNSVFEINSQQRLSASVTSSYTRRNCFFPSSFPVLLYGWSISAVLIFSKEIKSILSSFSFFPLFSCRSFTWKLGRVEAVAAAGPEWMRGEYFRDLALVKSQAWPCLPLPRVAFWATSQRPTHSRYWTQLSSVSSLVQRLYHDSNLLPPGVQRPKLSRRAPGWLASPWSFRGWGTWHYGTWKNLW